MRTFITKLQKDTIGVLAAIVSWNALTSVVPIAVSLLAITGFFLRGHPGAQDGVVSHLSQALKGVVTPAELTNMVTVAVYHAGLLGLIRLLAAFLLFAAIYLVFPHIEHRFRLSNVPWGALVAAVLIVALTFIWPLYAHFAHFGRYGTVLLPIWLLTAWIYVFSLILILGAEVVAIGALRRAQQENRAIGPALDGTVPQHVVLRELDTEGELETEQRPVVRS